MNRFVRQMIRGRRGVTFSELIIVVVVTLLLAIFFIFASRNLVIRSKVARVQEEQRVLQRALGNYQMDYSEFPRNEVGLNALNAPTTYLTSIPADPFGVNNHVYFYYRNPTEKFYYVVISAGPDGDVDFQEFLNQNATTPGETASDSGTEDGQSEPGDAIVTMPYRDMRHFLELKTYDPTNGVTSDGDIISYMPR